MVSTSHPWTKGGRMFEGRDEGGFRFAVDAPVQRMICLFLIATVTSTSKKFSRSQSSIVTTDERLTISWTPDTEVANAYQNAL